MCNRNKLSLVSKFSEGSSLYQTHAFDFIKMVLTLIYGEVLAFYLFSCSLQNNVGMTEALVDGSGYPRQDLDVYQVRHARHKIICKQCQLLCF